MHKIMQRTLVLSLTAVLMFGTLANTASAYEAEYTDAMSIEQVTESYNEIIAGLSAQNAQTQVTILEQEQAKLHNYADGLRMKSLSIKNTVKLSNLSLSAGTSYAALAAPIAAEDYSDEIAATGQLWQNADALKLDALAEVARQQAEAAASKKVSTRYDGVTVTAEERELMAKILYLEAGNQCDEGQIAVVEVIMNRVINSRFPNSVNGVIYARNQFTSVSKLPKAAPSEKQYQIVDMVLAGETYVLPDTVVYFSRGQANNRPYRKIQDHWFCYI